MQVYWEDKDDNPMGVPYGSAPERRFWNLKRSPELLKQIPEVADYPALAAFLKRVNAADSSFATLGCENWCRKIENTDGLTDECGLYVDIVFDVVELAQERTNYAHLYDRLRARGAILHSQSESSWCTRIIFQPGPVSFYDLNVAVWKASVWAHGFGTSVEMAAANRDRGLVEIGDCLHNASLELAALAARGKPLVSHLPV